MWCCYAHVKMKPDMSGSNTSCFPSVSTLTLTNTILLPVSHWRGFLLTSCFQISSSKHEQKESVTSLYRHRWLLIHRSSLHCGRNVNRKRRDRDAMCWALRAFTLPWLEAPWPKQISIRRTWSTEGPNHEHKEMISADFWVWDWLN